MGCFFLEYSHQERLCLGEFQQSRACFLLHDGTAGTREGSPRAWRPRGSEDGLGAVWLGTQGHRLSVENHSPTFPPLPRSSLWWTLVLVLRPRATTHLSRTQSPDPGLPETDSDTPASSATGPQRSYVVIGKRLEPGLSEAVCLLCKWNGPGNPNRQSFSKHPGFLNPA